MMMRRCEACEQPIPQRHFVEVSIRILRSDEGENQDPVEQHFGDYCDHCVAVGAAVEDLVAALTKYKGLEAERAAERAAPSPATAAVHPLACQGCGHSRIAHGNYDRCTECLCRHFVSDASSSSSSPAREPIQDIIASLRTREQERLAKAYGLPYDLKGIARSNSYLVALMDVEVALAFSSSSSETKT